MGDGLLSAEDDEEFSLAAMSGGLYAHTKKREDQKAPPPTTAKVFSASELKDMQKCFDVFDADKDGMVQEADLTRVMENNKMQITPEQIREIFEVVDTDKSGTIEFDEFTAMMLSVENGKSTMKSTLFTDAAKSEMIKAKRERQKRFSTFNPDTSKNNQSNNQVR
jgi:uncharacterized tellurite resistance protein B-like protein